MAAPGVDVPMSRTLSPGAALPELGLGMLVMCQETSLLSEELVSFLAVTIVSVTSRQPPVYFILNQTIKEIKELKPTFSRVLCCFFVQ